MPVIEPMDNGLAKYYKILVVNTCDSVGQMKIIIFHSYVKTDFKIWTYSYEYYCTLSLIEIISLLLKAKGSLLVYIVTIHRSKTSDDNVIGYMMKSCVAMEYNLGWCSGIIMYL